MRHFIKAATIAGALAVLTACAVGPNYVRPPAETPAAYKEMKDWKVAQPSDHAARGAWWEIFGDPQLNGLEEQVNISNQNLALAEAQFRQAVALVQAARAGYFPTATTGVSYTRLRQSTSVGGGTGGSSGTRSQGGPTSEYLLTGTASWQLDLWGKVRRTVEQSRANAQASAADLESVRLTVHAQLAQDYFQLRSLDAQKQLLDTTVDAYRRFLELTKNRYASGIASSSDVLQAETQLKTAQAQAIDIGVQRAQLEHAIAVLIGKPASDFSIPVSPLTGSPPAVPAGIPSELLERRPDIASAERLMAAANAGIGAAEAAYFPTLTLNASGGFSASHAADWFTWPSRFWSLGPATLQENLLDGGLRRAQTEQAIAIYDANVASYRQTVLASFQEVEDNLAALRILEEEAQAQDDAVKAARQSLAVTTNRYRAGTASSLDVITTQTIALNNEATAINMLGRRMTAGVLLVEFLGGGWESSGLPSADDVGRYYEKHRKAPGVLEIFLDTIRKVGSGFSGGNH